MSLEEKLAKLEIEVESDVVPQVNSEPPKKEVKAKHGKIKPKKPKKRIVTVRLSEEQYSKLVDLQEVYDCSLTALIEVALDKL